MGCGLHDAARMDEAMRDAASTCKQGWSQAQMHAKLGQQGIGSSVVLCATLLKTAPEPAPG